MLVDDEVGDGTVSAANQVCWLRKLSPNSGQSAKPAGINHL
ncbi:hypothetical protein ALTERO38_50373 [Alteromonas sp. 38]|nr:hypothetical protein ALTER154_80897 [Alteromonas sp. 154]VXB30876.1 hypothetical protein ALTERO38_50373 [Alteromonas sp. 38]